MREFVFSMVTAKSSKISEKDGRLLEPPELQDRKSHTILNIDFIANLQSQILLACYHLGQSFQTLVLIVKNSVLLFPQILHTVTGCSTDNRLIITVIILPDISRIRR